MSEDSGAILVDLHGIIVPDTQGIGDESPDSIVRAGQSSPNNASGSGGEQLHENAMAAGDEESMKVKDKVGFMKNKTMLLACVMQLWHYM